jgi:citrate lyase beta subunit
MLMAPAMGRQQSELLGTIIVREIDILSHAGLLPPPPQQLAESQGGLKIEYTSPLSKLLRAEEAQTIMTTVNGLAQIAAVKPEVLDVIDWQETPREFAEASGFPGKLLLKPEQVKEIQQQRQQQMEAAQVAAAAPGVSQAAKNLADAHQTMTQGGGQPNAGTPQG